MGESLPRGILGGIGTTTTCGKGVPIWMADELNMSPRRFTYHVLTPLRRFDNLTKLIPMLEEQRVMWEVITDDDLPFTIHFNKEWIRSYVCPNRETTFFTRCNFALNWYLDSYPPAEDHRFAICNDDDAYCDGFFDLIDAHDGEVIIPSMERGNRTPEGVIAERAHGFTKLVAAPENVHIGGVGVEQLIVSGRLLKNARLPLHICGDGMMIEWFYKTHGAEFAPEANVLFNKFEPGRWDA